MMAQLFDLLLVLTMLWLAARSLTDRDLFRGVLRYIMFGLLLALSWVRLRAPDVALAETAVGSALTGALLLSALARMKRREADEARVKTEVQP